MVANWLKWKPALGEETSVSHHDLDAYVGSVSSMNVYWRDSVIYDEKLQKT